MMTPHINKSVSILTDGVGCARRLNARNVSVLDTGGDRGRGVFSARDFLPGEVVIIGHIERLERIRTTNSIQLNWDVHALFEKPAVIVNHSCDPNLAIVPNRFGAYDFIAIREIYSDVEVTWDYATSEFECIGISVCLCGAANCRGGVLGFSKLPPNHPMVVSRFYAPYLEETLSNFRGK
ncbi:SET domain-containing protein-lysine N-methyltransferase [Mesorhizobium sp. Cs1299R1N3]|uniref:SET domain-containing protein-lysine N-methyltransferase n=1 Tax=Mesorhizobium sp. Cs1299R1N3 TaxID=3015173 RepID=UPI00301B7A3D